MRYLTLLLFLTIITSCKTTQTDDGSGAGVATAPSGLEGPAYDPSAGPVPMTASTPMPIPAGSQPQPAGQQPAAYGQRAPMANKRQAPATYGSVPMNPTRDAKGGVVTNAPAPSTAPATAPYGSNSPSAPQAYGSVATPSTYAAPQPNTPEAFLANQLTGMWVNGTDEREIVAFTPDHYTTYYNGEMLFQEPMTYHAACPGDCNGGAPMEIACFTISGPGGTDCYGIVRMTSTVLELSLLGVSTETVTYYKQ